MFTKQNFLRSFFSPCLFAIVTGLITLVSVSKLSADEMNLFQEDFAYFTNTLKEAHPNIYDGMPDFDSETEKVMQELAKVSDISEFKLLLTRFTHKLKDGHSGLSIFENLGDSSYPISLWWHETGWYLDLTDADHKGYLGAKVLSINGYDTDEVMQALIELSPGENIYYHRKLASFLLRHPTYLELLGFGSEDGALHLSLDQDGKTASIELLNKESHNLWNTQKTGITKNQYINYWGQALPEDKLFYLQFNSFSDHDGSDSYAHWKAFLGGVFSEIEEHQIDRLVIDLRENGGGNSMLGNILLGFCSLPDTLKNFSAEVKFGELFLENYDMDITTLREKITDELGDEPADEFPLIINYAADSGKISSKHYHDLIDNDLELKQIPKYQGDIIILIGSQTFSSAVMFATICKDNGLASLIGSPTGGKPSCYGDILSFRLPNTQSPCIVSHKYFRRPNPEFDSDDSLYPDINFVPTPQQQFSEHDALWEELILDNK